MDASVPLSDHHDAAGDLLVVVDHVHVRVLRVGHQLGIAGGRQVHQLYAGSERGGGGGGHQCARTRPLRQKEDAAVRLHRLRPGVCRYTVCS